MVFYKFTRGFPGSASGEEPACQCRRCKKHGAQSLGWEDPLEKGMSIHSSILVWRIPKTEKPGRLYSPRVAELDTTEVT